SVIDALRWALGRPHRPPSFLKKLCREPGTKWILVTAHRRENFGAPLKNICLALEQLARLHPEVRILYPVHLNPQVQGQVRGFFRKNPRIQLYPPLNYLDFAQLMKSCFLVLTDSGGLQEEAPALGKPVLVLRRVSERPEAIRAGTV